jgi:hypothetical protein
VSNDLSFVQFTLENRTTGPHATPLRVRGSVPGRYAVTIDDTPAGVLQTESDRETSFLLKVPDRAFTTVTLRRSTQ